MEVFKIYAINEKGLDNPKQDQEFECDPAKETLESIRQKIAETQLLSETPEKVTLIKRGKDQENEEEIKAAFATTREEIKNFALAFVQQHRLKKVSNA